MRAVSRGLGGWCLAVLCGVLACASGDRGGSQKAQPVPLEHTGTLGLRLQPVKGVTVTSVRYTPATSVQTSNHSQAAPSVVPTAGT
jgi:hypothetical protein